MENNIVKDVKNEKAINPGDAANSSSHLDALHIRNLFNNIKTSEKGKTDIDSGHKSTLLVPLGNIAQSWSFYGN